MTWPTEAFTVKALPRYLPMVLALAGLSTMTRARPLALAAATPSTGGFFPAAAFFAALGGAAGFLTVALARATLAALVPRAIPNHANRKHPPWQIQADLA